MLLSISGLAESNVVDTSVNWGQFSYTWTCVIILCIEFLMTLRKDLRIYIKLNTFGVAGIIILMVFLMTTGFISISDTDYTTSDSYYTSHPEITNLGLVKLFASHYARLMGILGGGFYFHNLALPVIKKNPNP